MIKYRLSFVMPGEVLFGLLAKLLPIEELNVEEIAPTPVRAKAAKAVAEPAHLPRLVKPKKRAPRQRGGFGINTEEGVNGAIMQTLADGKPHRYAELKRAVFAAGYAGSGIGSRLERLHVHKAVVRVQPGLWQKTASDESKSA